MNWTSTGAEMLSRDTKGDLTIEHIIVMVIVLVLLVVLVIYAGVLRESSAALLERVLGFFTGT